MSLNEGRAPTVVQAAVYTLATHFLKSMDAAKSEEGDVVVKQMKSLAVNDALWKNVSGSGKTDAASTTCILSR